MRGQRYALIGFKEFAKIGSRFVWHVIGLRFAALFAPARIEEAAVHATVHVRITMQAFILAQDFANKLDLSPTVVTNHNIPIEPIEPIEVDDVADQIANLLILPKLPILRDRLNRIEDGRMSTISRRADGNTVESDFPNCARSFFCTYFA
ncbi:MAG: hypothetical protein M3X11_01030 [Acidobacteriota bacterium]|nr:hypothetical protein [Acidobacteriota bacterium]